jgi:hypothetical protein
MKRFSTTIETVDALKTSIDNSRASGIFKNGNSFEEFAANVAAYITYCETYGCGVLEEARPDHETLCDWYGAALNEKIHQQLLAHGLFVAA